jgi:hypothetical protein
MSAAGDHTPAGPLRNTVTHAALLGPCGQQPVAMESVWDRELGRQGTTGAQAAVGERF